MHCRFFKEHLAVCGDRRWDLLDLGVSNLETKVQESFQGLDQVVLVVGQTVPNGCTKLSVTGEDKTNFAFVHISFSSGSCYAKYQNGMCREQLLNKKKVPKTADVSQLSTGCIHLHQLMLNIKYLHSLFPDFFNSSGDHGYVQAIPPPAVPENTEDASADIENLKSVQFNTQSRKWVGYSLSVHRPRDMTDHDLVEKAASRLTYIQQSNQFGGSYIGPDLFPDYSSTDGSPIACPCGSVYIGPQ